MVKVSLPCLFAIQSTLLMLAMCGIITSMVLVSNDAIDEAVTGAIDNQLKALRASLMSFVNSTEQATRVGAQLTKAWKDEAYLFETPARPTVSSFRYNLEMQYAMIEQNPLFSFTYQSYETREGKFTDIGCAPGYCSIGTHNATDLIIDATTVPIDFTITDSYERDPTDEEYIVTIKNLNRNQTQMWGESSLYYDPEASEKVALSTYTVPIEYSNVTNLCTLAFSIDVSLLWIGQMLASLAQADNLLFLVDTRGGAYTLMATSLPEAALPLGNTSNGDPESLAMWNLPGTPNSLINNVFNKLQSDVFTNPGGMASSKRDVVINYKDNIVSVVHLNSDGLHWLAIDITPKEFYFGRSRRVMLTLIIVSCVVVVACAALCLGIYMAVVRPLAKMSAAMENVSKLNGAFDGDENDSSMTMMSGTAESPNGHSLPPGIIPTLDDIHSMENPGKGGPGANAGGDTPVTVVINSGRTHSATTEGHRSHDDDDNINDDDGLSYLTSGMAGVNSKNGRSPRMQRKAPVLSELLPIHAALSRLDRAIASFTRYVPRDVVKDLLSADKLCELGMAPMRCTVLFVDIASFTSLSERLPIATLSDLVNLYFDISTRIIGHCSGSIDKFIGDCIMAVWGAPLPVSHAETRATLCALQLNRVCYVEPLRGSFAAAGESLKIRVGVNAGEVLAGNMGSSQRMNYTVIGDPVNLASRLESLNKQFGTHVMVSEEIAAVIRPANAIVLRLLARIAVVGKDVPVEVYEAVGIKPDLKVGRAVRVLEENAELIGAGEAGPLALESAEMPPNQTQPWNGPSSSNATPTVTPPGGINVSNTSALEIQTHQSFGANGTLDPNYNASTGNTSPGQNGIVSLPRKDGSNNSTNVNSPGNNNFPALREATTSPALNGVTSGDESTDYDSEFDAKEQTTNKGRVRVDTVTDTNGNGAGTSPGSEREMLRCVSVSQPGAGSDQPINSGGTSHRMRVRRGQSGILNGGGGSSGDADPSLDPLQDGVATAIMSGRGGQPPLNPSARYSHGRSPESNAMTVHDLESSGRTDEHTSGIFGTSGRSASRSVLAPPSPKGGAGYHGMSLREIRQMSKRTESERRQLAQSRHRGSARRGSTSLNGQTREDLFDDDSNNNTRMADIPSAASGPSSPSRNASPTCPNSRLLPQPEHGENAKLGSTGTIDLGAVARVEESHVFTPREQTHENGTSPTPETENQKSSTATVAAPSMPPGFGANTKTPHQSSPSQRLGAPLSRADSMSSACTHLDHTDPSEAGDFTAENGQRLQFNSNNSDTRSNRSNDSDPAGARNAVGIGRLLAEAKFTLAVSQRRVDFVHRYAGAVRLFMNGRFKHAAHQLKKMESPDFVTDEEVAAWEKRMAAEEKVKDMQKKETEAHDNKDDGETQNKDNKKHQERKKHKVFAQEWCSQTKSYSELLERAEAYALMPPADFDGTMKASGK